MDEMKMVSVEVSLALWGAKQAIKHGELEKALKFIERAEEKVEELKEIEAKYLSKL